MSKYLALLTHSSPSYELIPVLFCTLGEWHPDVHQAVLSIATVIASRAMIPFKTTRPFLFQRHAAQLVAGNANCFMQGRVIKVYTCVYVFLSTSSDLILKDT